MIQIQTEDPPTQTTVNRINAAAEALISAADTPETPATVATLFIANIRTNRNQFVYGVSGAKYLFRFSKAHDRCVREYTTKAAFDKEELDIRKNVRNSLFVCTMIGSVGVVKSANDAVDALISERLKIAGHAKRDALLKLANKIEIALAAMFPESADPFSRPSTTTEAAPPALLAHESAPVEAIPKFTTRELAKMGINDILALGARHGLTSRDREEIRKQILDIQERK